MAQRLDTNSRDILTFRPTINFVEPDAVGEDPVPQSEGLQLEDVLAERRSLVNLAKSVNTLATAVQARADDRAKGMEVTLDENVDADAIAAMRRQFPDEDPNRITHAQYRECKDKIRSLGEAVGRKGAIDPDEVKIAADRIAEGQAFTELGGFNTPGSRTGGLRPELDGRLVILPPLSMAEFQINIICILVNFIWKNFIKKTIEDSSPPVSTVFKLMPDRLCDPGGDIEIPGLFILGEKPPIVPKPPDIPLTIVELL